MGAKNGKAAFEDASVPFLNRKIAENLEYFEIPIIDSLKLPSCMPLTVSFAALERLWEAFNDVADGFGISQYEMEVNSPSHSKFTCRRSVMVC